MSQSHPLRNDPSTTRLISLAKLAMASEIEPRDARGPYLILQTGYEPGDVTMKATEYLLGRSGEWLALYWFLRMPLQDRRAEFVFGTVTEVMTVMEGLCGDVRVITSLDGIDDDTPADEEWQGAFSDG